MPITVGVRRVDSGDPAEICLDEVVAECDGMELVFRLVVPQALLMLVATLLTFSRACTTRAHAVWLSRFAVFILCAFQLAFPSVKVRAINTILPSSHAGTHTSSRSSRGMIERWCSEPCQDRTTARSMHYDGQDGASSTGREHESELSCDPFIAASAQSCFAP